MTDWIGITLLALFAIGVVAGVAWAIRAYLTNPAVWADWVVWLWKNLIWPSLLVTFAPDFSESNAKRVREEARRNQPRPPKYGHGGEH